MMDNKLLPSARVVTATVSAILLAVLMYWLHGATRLQLVATIGVLMADTLDTTMLVIAVLSGIVAGTLIVMSARRAYKLNRTATQAALEAKRAADRSAEEAKQWNTLPSRDETNPDVLEPMLRRIANRYSDTDVKKGIKDTLKQLTSIRRSLAKINDIFDANAGMMSHDKRFENNQLLVEKVLEEICPGLIRIIYQAHEHDGVDTFLPDLIQVINEVNTAYRPHVDETQDLANGVVKASTEGDTESILTQVKDATDKLNAALEGWL